MGKKRRKEEMVDGGSGRTTEMAVEEGEEGS